VLAIDPTLCNGADKSGLTPFMYAASNKQAKFIMFCLMLGTPRPASTGCQRLGSSESRTSESLDSTSLTPACEETRQLDRARDSTRQEGSETPTTVVVDVLAQCHLGRTALHYAAATNDVASSVALLSIQPMMPDRHYKSSSQDEALQCAPTLVF
jgi:ankyrin repeat protein